MLNRPTFYAGLLAIAIAALPVNANAAQAVVNCAAGEKIQAALDAAASDRQVSLTVSGNCTENVQIARSDVTIMGAAPDRYAAALTGLFNVVGAKNVRIEGFAIHDNPAGTGIRAAAGAEVTVVRSSVRQVDFGIRVMRQAKVIVNKSIVRSNYIGILTHEQSQLYIANSTVISDSQRGPGDPYDGFYGAALVASAHSSINAVFNNRILRAPAVDPAKPRISIRSPRAPTSSSAARKSSATSCRPETRRRSSATHAWSAG